MVVTQHQTKRKAVQSARTLAAAREGFGFLSYVHEICSTFLLKLHIIVVQISASKLYAHAKSAREEKNQKFRRQLPPRFLIFIF